MGLRPLTPGAVGADIDKIIQTQELDPLAIQHSAIIHTPQHDINVTELVSIETSRDYANEIADYVLVDFRIGLGTYVKLLHPHMDNLEMTIKTTYYNKVYGVRYKMLLGKGPSSLTGSHMTSYSMEELNKQDYVLVEVQCVNRTVEALRLATTNGIYNYATVKEVIKTSIGNAIQDLKINGTTLDTVIDMIQPNNEQSYRHINIPAGTRILDVPTYLQRTDYGVYSSGIGTYVQTYGYFDPVKKPRDVVFVYPLYNSERTTNIGKKLMVLSTPLMNLSNVENSYMVDGDVIKIIGAANVISDDVSQQHVIDNGNALISTDTNRIMESGSDVTDSTVKADKKITIAGKRLINKTDSLDGMNYVKPSSNPYKTYSEVAKNLLSKYQFTWNFSNPELLFPGMSIMYVYEDTDYGVLRLKGVIHSVYTKYNHYHKSHTTIINALLEPYSKVSNNKSTTVDVSR